MTEPETIEEAVVAPRKTAKDLPWKLRGFLALVFGAIIGAIFGSVAGLANYVIS
jgi:hypothetical protein